MIHNYLLSGSRWANRYLGCQLLPCRSRFWGGLFVLLFVAIRERQSSVVLTKANSGTRSSGLRRLWLDRLSTRCIKSLERVCVRKDWFVLFPYLCIFSLWRPNRIASSALLTTGQAKRRIFSLLRSCHWRLSSSLD